MKWMESPILIYVLAAATIVLAATILWSWPT